MGNTAERGGAATSRTTVRVRYPETDRMGRVHHSHYLVWFEIGRTELMRELGCPYADLEERQGIYFPVIAAGARYHAPARYDEELTVTTRLASVGRARVKFEYRIGREGEAGALATGFSEHAAVDGQGRPRRLPSKLRERLLVRR